MSRNSIITSLQAAAGNGSPTFTGTPTAASYAVTVGGTRTFGYSVVTDHLAGNAGSVGLTITDGGGAAGVFVVNTHSGSYNSQEVVVKTSQGGVTLSTEQLRIRGNGKIAVNTAALVNAVDDAAASAAGVAVGELYRTGSFLAVRIT
jgi:hypothetical protein